MKVILNADVPNLGEEGDVREVKRGYARNFLVPRNMAMPYNKQSMALIESRRALIEKRKEEKRAQAQGLKERIEAEALNLKMPAGENGRLFGAVTSATVAEELAKLGITVERKRIEIPEHTIKASGNHRVHVKLYGNEEAVLRVLVNQQQKAEGAGEEPDADAKPDSSAKSDAGTKRAAAAKPAVAEAPPKPEEKAPEPEAEMEAETEAEVAEEPAADEVEAADDGEEREE